MKLFDWVSVSISLNSTIRESLTVLDQQAMQIVLLVSNEKKLIATITDGDIRRGLLQGKSLDSLAIDVANHSPTIGFEDEGINVWEQHLSRKSIRHLPIINTDKVIVGLFYQKITSTPQLKNPIVLMLGGLGMRLRPLTETIPKPMLLIGNKPILETIVKHIAKQGFTEFYFCINYLGEKIKQYFGDGRKWGISITYIEENKPLGTAGALSLLPQLPNLPLIVMNGDLLTKADFKALLNFHLEHDNNITTCVREYSHQVPYGVMEIQGQQITNIVEKPIYNYFVNAGIYCLNNSLLAKIPKQKFYDMPMLLETQKNKKSGGFPLTEYWKDIGQILDYEQAQIDFEIYFS